MLRFQNLVIRKAQITDVPQLVSWWNDGKVMAHAGFPNGLGTTSEKVISLLQKDTEDRCHFIIEIDNASVGEMHYKKIKDFLADKKIPKGERDIVPLLVTNNGKIAWVAPYRRGVGFAPDENTKNIIKLTIEKENDENGNA